MAQGVHNGAAPKGPGLWLVKGQKLENSLKLLQTSLISILVSEASPVAVWLLRSSGLDFCTGDPFA